MASSMETMQLHAGQAQTIQKRNHRAGYGYPQLQALDMLPQAAELNKKAVKLSVSKLWIIKSIVGICRMFEFY